MLSLNKVQVIGFVGKEPDIRMLQSGRKTCSLSVACDDSYKKDGEWVKRTNWVPIVVFNEHLINHIEKYISKGTKIYASGKFVTRKWEDKNGNDRYTTEVVISGYDDTIFTLDKINSDNNNHNDSYCSSAMIDDDIPF